MAVVPRVTTTVPMFSVCEESFEGVEVDAASVVGWNRDEGQTEDAADAAVGVVGLIGGGDGFAGSELAGDPEGFEVGEGSSAGEMAEMLGPAEHLCERGDGFDLHGGAGAAAVEGVVVGIDRHGQRVGGAGDGVRRLEHLPGVERMGVGVVVVELDCYFIEDGGGGFVQWRRGAGGKVREGFVEAVLGFGEELEEIVCRFSGSPCVFGCEDVAISSLHDL